MPCAMLLYLEGNALLKLLVHLYVLHFFQIMADLIKKRLKMRPT